MPKSRLISIICIANVLLGVTIFCIPRAAASDQFLAMTSGGHWLMYSTDGTHLPGVTGQAPTNVSRAAWGPDGHLYIGSFVNGSVRRYHGQNHGFIDDFVLHESEGQTSVYSISFGPDNKLYMGTSDSILRFDAHTGEFIDTFASGSDLDLVTELSFLPNGRLVAASFNRNQILSYDVEHPEESPEVISLAGRPRALEVADDGSLYVLSYAEGVLRYESVDGGYAEEPEVFISWEQLALAAPSAMAWGDDGDLYIGSSYPTVDPENPSGVTRFDQLLGTRIAQVAHIWLGVNDVLWQLNPGDVDRDQDVDLSDLGSLAAHYGLTIGATWAQGDLDFDGDVDLNDLSTLAANYGAGEAQAFADFEAISSVPEPVTGLALCFTAVVLGRFRGSGTR